MGTCQNCSEELENPFFCRSCSQVQELKELPNYYHSLNLPLSFSPDLYKVELQYEDFLMEIHPDSLSGEAPQKRLLGLKYSSHLKMARDRLSLPFERAIHLMGLLFDQTPSEKDFTVDTDFLTEVFELQENIDAEEIDEQTKFSTLGRLEKNLKEISLLFQKELEQHNPKNYDELLRLLAQLKFFQNLKEKLDSYS